jgi:acetyl esterase
VNGEGFVVQNSLSPMVTVEDVIWHRPSQGPLAARLYRPAVPVGPAVVSVHGGRWCAESRLTNAVIDTALAEAGVFVMAIDFRMPPAVRYPEPVADINLAIRWLKSKASAFGFDPGSIGGIGTSSGGHQLLLNALLPGDMRYAAQRLPDGGEPDATLAFCVACWAVTDPLARYRHALANAMQVHIESHHAYWRDEQEMDEGSPQRLVEHGLATHLPPLLMIQGTGDTVLTPDMAQRFATAYGAAGGAVELVEFAGAGHTFITKEPAREDSRAAMRLIRDFVVARGMGA